MERVAFDSLGTRYAGTAGELKRLADISPAPAYESVAAMTQ
ncbi:hypothetical protein AB0C14_02390 [Microbispora hainanensis]